MSIMKSLKLAAATPALAADPKQAARAKALAYLQDQKALATADLSGTPYTPMRTIFRKNEAGERVAIQAPRRVRRGFVADAQGIHFLELRYAGKPIELAKGMTAVEVGRLEGLGGVVDQLIGAVNAGELDDQLASAAAARRANFKPRGKKA